MSQSGTIVMNDMPCGSDARILSRDTERIFKEIEEIRRKQIELGSEHVNLESIDDMSLTTTAADTKDEYKRNLESFNRKEDALKSLMSKLDTLGQIMNDFREAADLNPHTMNIEAKVDDITTTIISPATPSTSTFN